jgi:hypothetical protein
MRRRIEEELKEVKSIMNKIDVFNEKREALQNRVKNLPIMGTP